MLMSENTMEAIPTETEEEEEENLQPRSRAEHLKQYHWKPGESGNPGGRPKGTLKDYDRQRFLNMSDEEKEAFLSRIDPAFRYRMAEGNPTEDKQITVKVPTPILGGVSQLSLEERQNMAQNHIVHTQNPALTAGNEALQGALSDEIEGGGTLHPSNGDTETSDMGIQNG
jgi:hypothetical protein